MIRSIVMIISLAALGGCVRQNPEQLAALQAQASRPVTCSGPEDCQEKWSRAIQWVRVNSSYKFQSATDYVIQTMGPLPNDPAPAFTITRVATGNGGYAFDFGGGCDNFLGCIPSMLASKASFVSYVMGPG